MNFDNYRYFAAAAEELNFTKAARKLFMTQQALSKQIDKMEKEYNTRLFNRETPMSLTPAGECMYRHVCRILDNERQMRAELDAVLGQESRNLVVGVSYFRSSILIPRIMKEFSGLHPEICVTVKEKNLAGCVADLKLGKLDLMFGYHMEDDPALVSHRCPGRRPSWLYRSPWQRNACLRRRSEALKKRGSSRCVLFPAVPLCGWMQIRGWGSSLTGIAGRTASIRRSLSYPRASLRCWSAVPRASGQRWSLPAIWTI